MLRFAPLIREIWCGSKNAMGVDRVCEPSVGVRSESRNMSHRESIAVLRVRKETGLYIGEDWGAGVGEKEVKE